MKLDYLIVIPARYKSSRFEGKPLVEINGKSMIERVWEKCIKLSPRKCVVVATDDKRIFQHCDSKKINVVMTSKKCVTGTDRVAEVSKKIEANFYVNVQGDEPLVNPNDIMKVIRDFKKNKITNCAATIIKDENELNNPNIPKIVSSKKGFMLYISRSNIPSNKKLNQKKLKKQVCIYCFSKDALSLYGVNSAKTQLEKIEDIEILRVLEHGIPIRVIDVKSSSIAVDTPEDLIRVKKICK